MVIDADGLLTVPVIVILPSKSVSSDNSPSLRISSPPTISIDTNGSKTSSEVGLPS